ncbi:MAG: bifunctional aspartate kinase/homoserine dehydrogenase I [Cytophagales bacterium]|nr:MAG: bifunctional aspartate kinase/homoserine dehydrogenase I [Cytophagales bacterium]
MKILKFGGTSVGSAETIATVCSILKKHHQNNQQFSVVFSAMSGITNDIIMMSKLAAEGKSAHQDILKKIEERHVSLVKTLIDVKVQSRVIANVKKLINELEDVLNSVLQLWELSLRTQDYLLSFGERLSAYIVSEYLKENGIQCEFLDARELVKTDSNFGNAKVDFKATEKNIKSYFENHKVAQVITGFIASNEQGETTTLGRGGSDYTASIFASAIGAEEIEIWTDVDGMMTADPRKVKRAFTLPALSYVEAMEMSHFGAKVIYPPTLQPAFNKKIPIWIKNTFNPEFEGTIISAKSRPSDFLIKGITSIQKIALVSLQGSGIMGVPGASARLFNALAKEKINIILITQASSEYSICFAIEPSDSDRAKSAIESEFAQEIHDKKVDKAHIENNLSIIAIIGDNMRHTSGISGKLFSTLGKNGINVIAIAQGSSELNLSVVIPEHDLNKALNSLHESFFYFDQNSLNVFLVGLGLIGKTLLNQIEKQAQFLLEKRLLKINVIAISNTSKMYFDADSIPLNHWDNKLNEKGESASLPDFINQMIALNLPNSVFVDCTSSKEVIKHYEEILNSSISIVTPNKLANSGTGQTYQKLRNSAMKHGAKFLYETNVGAGLPVINTLQDLIFSGDEILKIEGILSGTLSYIFNTFKGDKKFSDVVKEAKEKGFTEPDPRDDLNGMDVARKILILSREVGVSMEIADVSVENILPELCLKAKTVDEFLDLLEQNNHVFSERREKADKEAKVLRFIASLEQGKAKVTLQAVDANHPFYSLSGSDNMIAFTTQRYKERPLVIKGPGAGAEVTAAGVFAEIISISNYLKG